MGRNRKEGKRMAVERLTEAERAQLPAILPAWRLVEGRDAIARSFRFRDFSEAWGFMARVALLAEGQDHHPEWSNVWNRVEIVLSTHDAGGLSARDLRLAQAIDALLA
jgi:4a-hydroxytetrahydrobiopterin dehydratase